MELVVEEVAEGTGSEVELDPVTVCVASPTRYDGGGVAVLGSTRAPKPQGIASPSGCVALGSLVVLPVASAMAKRPVHVRLGALGDENW